MNEQQPFVVDYRMCHESSCMTLCNSIYNEIALLLDMNPNITLSEECQIALDDNIKIVGLTLETNGIIRVNVSTTKKWIGKKGENSFVLGEPSEKSKLNELFNNSFFPYNYIVLIESIRKTLGIKPSNDNEEK